MCLFVCLLVKYLVNHWTYWTLALANTKIARTESVFLDTELKFGAINNFISDLCLNLCARWWLIYITSRNASLINNCCD